MKELKKAIDAATSVLIVLPLNASDGDYLAALQTKTIAPDKIKILAPEEQEKKWQSLFNTPAERKEFVITIDTSISPVTDLRYERDNNNIAIYLSHPYTFDKSALSYQEKLPEADLFISIGFAGDQIAREFIKTLPKKFDAVYMSLNNKEAVSDGPSATAYLSIQHAGLLGRLLARSREDISADTLWTFLTESDFEKTQTAPSAVSALFELFSKLTKLPRITIILWQAVDGVYGTILSKDRAVIDTFMKLFGTTGTALDQCPTPRYENFVEAEIELRSLLRQYA